MNVNDLIVGRSYEVSMLDDSVICFRYIGVQAGKPYAESPPASGHLIRLKDLLSGGYLAYWPIS
jgi:hypothetical protein